MRRAVPLLAAIAVALSVGGPAAWSRPAHLASAACSPAGSQTLASSRSSRVYALGGKAYACLDSNGKTYKLGSATLCIGGVRAGPFALAGGDVAYGATSCGIDFSSSELIVKSLVSGRTLRRAPATNTSLVEQEGGVRSLVLKADGSVAWIATEQSLGNHHRLLQLFKDDKGGLKLLDSGLSVAPSSLKLRGSQLTWRRDGTSRHATLQ
jgi:hypothetical protein